MAISWEVMVVIPWNGTPEFSPSPSLVPSKPLRSRSAASQLELTFS